MVAKYAHHEDERLRKQAEKAWDMILVKGKRIEKEALKADMTIPGEAKSSKEVLREIAAKMKTDGILIF